MTNKKEYATIVGLLAGMLLICITILNRGGSLWMVLDWNAMFLVLGGTLSAAMINFPFSAILRIKNTIVHAFNNYEESIEGIINIIVDAGNVRRNKGLRGLEKYLPNIQYSFLQTGLDLAINENDAKKLERVLNLELENMINRHEEDHDILLFLGTYSPAFGLIGTIIGLIVMMHGGFTQNHSYLTFNVAQSFSKLLSGMGLAMTTTLYGIILANLFFFPIGGKLKRLTANKILVKRLMIEGILSVHSNDHPIQIREKLATFLPESKRENIL
jgi:chemotaxis protein MotA